MARDQQFLPAECPTCRGLGSVIAVWQYIDQRVLTQRPPRFASTLWGSAQQVPPIWTAQNNPGNRPAPLDVPRPDMHRMITPNSVLTEREGARMAA